MKNTRKHLFAATILMATSTVGPGFLTQTTVFTEKLVYNFGFVILLTIFIDFIAQLIIWKTLTFANTSIYQLGNNLLRGLGTFIVVFIAFGGLIFNIANLAGAGMGLNAIFNLSHFNGVCISALMVILLFFMNNLLPKLDLFLKIMGVLMVVLLLVMIYHAKVDFIKLFSLTFQPEKIDIKATITLVGGTVGGYIAFSGAQRLLEAGVVGKENNKVITKSAYTGVLISGIYRYLLYIGILSVVLSGALLKQNNPVQTVFESHFGYTGKILFGLMIWSSSIAALVGVTYTILSFMKDLSPSFTKHKKYWSLVFIGLALVLTLAINKPVNILVFSGYLNAFILPIGLVIVLLSLQKKRIFQGHTVSPIIQVLAWSIVGILTYFSVVSLF